MCVLLYQFLHQLYSLTNGIIVKQLTPDHFSHIEEVTMEKDQTQMVSVKRSVMVNEATIPEYHVAKRICPSLPPISIDSIQKTF